MLKRQRARYLQRRLTLPEHGVQLWGRIESFSLLRLLYATPIIPEIATSPKALVLITTRYNSLLQPGILLVANNKQFKIINICNENEDNKWLKLLAEELFYATGGGDDGE